MTPEIKPLNLNRWQLFAHLYASTRNKVVGGRGIGKTTYLSWRLKNKCEDMPRSANALVCRTYLQALTRTIPAIIAGLESLGWLHGRDYVIGKEPPKSWPKPFFPPVSYEHFISTKTGAGYHIVSQDRKGSSRGFNIDSWDADEGLNLNKQQIDDEISVATRANVGRFDYSRYHLTEFIVSSQPILPESQWLLEDADYYRQGGYAYQEYRDSLTNVLLNMIDSESEAEMQAYWEEALTIKQNWKWYRDVKTIPITNEKISTFFIDADVFDNIQNLGWKYVKQQRASMSDLAFKVEILNALFTISENGFYPDLSERHLYDIQDYSILDKYGYALPVDEEISSLQDPSIESKAPLHMAMDYGGSFNCMVVSQEYVDEERIVAGFHEYHPKKTSDVVAQFIKFFQYHHDKTVYYYHDQTAIGTDGSRDYTYADEVMMLLSQAGWKVVSMYMGQAPTHFLKYLFFGNILSERDTRQLPRIRMHRERCRPLYQSMKLVASKQGSKGVEKDKTPERKSTVDQVRAPHYSDAFDQLVYYKHASKQGQTKSSASKMEMSS